MRGAPHSGLAVVVLAAGAATRFGSAKQLAEVEGRPALLRTLDAVDGIGAPQIVVLGASVDAVRPVVSADRWRIVEAAGWGAGIGASLRAGLAAASEVDTALIVLGDLPWLRREAVARVLAAAAADPRAEAVRACEGGRPGHPVLVRGSLLEAARRAPDDGLAGVLAAVRVLQVDCEGLGVARDLDRLEDLAGGD